MPDDAEMMGDEMLPAEDHRNPRRRRRENGPPDVGVLVTPEPRHELAKLVLHGEARGEIATALRSLAMAEQMEEVWKLSQIRPMAGRCMLNFYGPPGTGKTRAALGLALELGKPLYQVDYSAIVSKYLGDTAKHIVLAFRQARERHRPGQRTLRPSVPQRLRAQNRLQTRRDIPRHRRAHPRRKNRRAPGQSILRQRPHQRRLRNQGGRMNDFHDPLWRRALVSLGISIISLGERIYTAGPIGWRDRLRWKLEDIGSRIFDAGHHGSNDEARMYINGDIPWEYAPPELQERLLREFPEYFETKEAA